MSHQDLEAAMQPMGGCYCCVSEPPACGSRPPPPSQSPTLLGGSVTLVYEDQDVPPCSFCKYAGATPQSKYFEGSFQLRTINNPILREPSCPCSQATAQHILRVAVPEAGLRELLFPYLGLIFRCSNRTSQVCASHLAGTELKRVEEEEEGQDPSACWSRLLRLQFLPAEASEGAFCRTKRSPAQNLFRQSRPEELRQERTGPGLMQTQLGVILLLGWPGRQGQPFP